MSQPKNHAIADSGAGYFIKGFELIRKKGIRRFVFIPLSINLIMFSIAFYSMFLQLEHYMEILNQWLPEWLNWLSVVIWPLAIITVLVVFSFIFTTIANWISAPFNGLLSEKIEAILTGNTAPGGKFSDVVKDIPRTLGREWQKLSYTYLVLLVFSC